ncbi:MAG: MBL fold metallo-hydrolase [Armatimonadota bacterium]
MPPGGAGALTLTLGGNAAVLLQADNLRVATDPWLSDRIGPWSRWRPAGLRPEELAPLDALLISHAHPDHLDLRSLRDLPPETPVLTPGGTPLRALTRAGFRNVFPQREWEPWERERLRVTAVPSIHTRWSLGYVVELGGTRVYFAGDAGPGTPFGEIARRCGPIDVALIPVGGSALAPGPFQRHLTPRMAAEATAELRPSVVVPMHWGHVPCVPAWLDRFRGTAERFRTELEARSLETRLLLPEEGVPTPVPLRR